MLRPLFERDTWHAWEQLNQQFQFQYLFCKERREYRQLWEQYISAKLAGEKTGHVVFFFLVFFYWLLSDTRFVSQVCGNTWPVCNRLRFTGSRIGSWMWTILVEEGLVGPGLLVMSLRVLLHLARCFWTWCVSHLIPLSICKHGNRTLIHAKTIGPRSSGNEVLSARLKTNSGAVQL